MQVVPILRYKDTAAVHPPRRRKCSQKITQLQSTLSAIFPSILLKRASVYRFLYRNPRLKLDLKNQKNNLFAQYYKDIFGHPYFGSDLETTILASSSSKSLNYTVINLSLVKLPILTIGKFTTSTRNDKRFKKMWKYWEHLRCVAPSFLIVAMTIAILKFLGTYIVRIQRVRVKFACIKRVLYSLERSDYQCLQCESLYQVRNVPSRNKQIRFL